MTLSSLNIDFLNLKINLLKAIIEDPQQSMIHVNENFKIKNVYQTDIA